MSIVSVMKSPSNIEITIARLNAEQLLLPMALNPPPLDVLKPDSLIWQFFGDSRFMFIVGQSFILQIALPIIDSAIETQSTYKEDPWGRTQRSFKYLWPIVYSRPHKARHAGEFLRTWHKDIKGIDKNGKHYNAFDPEAYTWVHITAFDAMVRLAKLIRGKDLTTQEQQQLFQEWRNMGLLLGCKLDDMPANVDAYWHYFEHMINTRLAYTDSVHYWMDKQFIQNLIKPSRFIPDSLWALLKKPAGNIFDIILRASLPSLFRQRFDIPLSHKEQRQFTRWLKLANMLWPLLPVRLQYVPYAVEGVKDARKNPAAFKE